MGTKTPDSTSSTTGHHADHTEKKSAKAPLAPDSGTGTVKPLAPAAGTSAVKPPDSGTGTV